MIRMTQEQKELFIHIYTNKTPSDFGRHTHQSKYTNKWSMRVFTEVINKELSLSISTEGVIYKLKKIGIYGLHKEVVGEGDSTPYTEDDKNKLMAICREKKPEDYGMKPQWYGVWSYAFLGSAFEKETGSKISTYMVREIFRSNDVTAPSKDDPKRKIKQLILDICRNKKPTDYDMPGDSWTVTQVRFALKKETDRLIDPVTARRYVKELGIKTNRGRI